MEVCPEDLRTLMRTAVHTCCLEFVQVMASLLGLFIAFDKLAETAQDCSA